ncbi:MAG: FixG Ig-like domain-containing protein, partial [Rhodoferax sp.]
YECIGCGACADVCDEVMDKMNYPRGLVKYSTENAVNERWTQSQTLRHVFRPRVLVYTAILWTVIALMLVSLARRAPFKVDVERDRSTLSREVPGGLIENVFRLQIMNASEQAQKVHIQADGLDGLQVVTDPDLVIDAAQSRWVVVRLQVPVESVKPGSHPIHFEVDGQDSHTVVIEKTVFIVPR